MTSPRSYRGALDHEAALDEIEACAGTQFDPVVASVFVELGRERAPRLLAADG